jgi:hypothetical protein
VQHNRTEEETMKARTAIGIVIACALALVLSAPATRADERDQATQLTFNQAVQIPGGVVLPPGTYWFKVGQDVTDQNVVRVTDANGSIIATTLAISTDRPAITDHTELKMAEGTSSEPLILVKWFYPDRTIGHEFVYSKPMESQISEDSMLTVKATLAPSGTQIATARY